MQDVETLKSFDLMPYSPERARGVVVTVPDDVAVQWKALGMVKTPDPTSRKATPQDGQPDPIPAPPVGSPDGSAGALSSSHRDRALPKPDYTKPSGARRRS